MKIPVGPFLYEVRLVSGYVLDPDGRRCLGLTYPDRQLIEVSDVPPSAKRLATLWHEIAHAWKCELDITQADELDGESIANLIGLAMAAMPIKTFARLHCYVTRGVKCGDVMLLGGACHPVPILSMGVPGAAKT